MRLKELTLNHYRNYDALDLTFDTSLNIFLGENAQGKTNLLESIYVLAMTRSHRTSHEKELIQWDAEGAKLQGTVEKRTANLPLEIQITAKGRKTKVNHIEQKKLSAYIGQLNVILFAPEDLSLVKGSPQVRRRFLDMELGQVSPIYLYDLVQFQGVLKQRNQYLKMMNDDKEKKDELYLDILTEQLAEFGAKVLVARLEFIEKLQGWANKLHTKISHGKEELTLSYESSFPFEKEADFDEIREAYFEALMKNRKREIFKANTFLGPHRDELLFHVNGRNVAQFGSQGQQRTTALSVKLAEIDLMESVTGEYPLLLLDDVMSELDNERQLHLLEAIEGKTQTFVTTTTLDHLKNLTVTPKIFHVENGTVEE
ncbi:MAG: DNA replication/repair protein RecF [Lactobacillales bacterium]|jgi:DNA replication and repair protein RecF|nr:DNA replication/repair protein RecF [Lactobacillales bacterium]